MNQQDNIAASYASAIQEVGVLLLVFGPMYLTFESTISGWLLALGMLAWLISGFLVFRIGIEIQRRYS